MTFGSTPPLSEDAIGRNGTAATGVIEAEQAADDRLSKLERRRKILDERKKIKDLEDELSVDPVPE